MALTQEQKKELYNRIVTQAKKDAAKQTATKVLKHIGRAGKKLVSSTDKKLTEMSKSKVGESGSKAFKGVTKAYKQTKKLSTDLMKQYTGSAGYQSAYGTGSSGGVRPVGRPAGVMKHRSPFTGKPIPAPQFYKELRAFRRLQTQQADTVQQQQQRQFARQGVPPQQIQNVVEQRMKQQFIQQQMQQRPMPQQVQRPQMEIQSQAIRPIWRRYNTIRQERDVFGNVKQVQGGNDPRNFWN